MSLTLWTAATPNGWKVSIMLEELLGAGVELPELEVRNVSLADGEQFSDEYTALNPNQKIPTLVHDGRSIMETGAILSYLGETFPTSLLPLDEGKWEVLPWLYWQVANLGPVFGNKLSYTRYMPDVPVEQKVHPLERFNKEAQRLLSVMSNKLGDSRYLCGEDFTIADIACYPWVRGYKWSKIDITLHPNIVAWVERVRERPGVERGLRYGMPEEETDRWNAETRARYARMGNSIASNDRLRSEQ